MGTEQLRKFATVKFHFADGNSTTFVDVTMTIVDAPMDGWTVASKGKYHFVNARHVVLAVAEPEPSPV